MKTCLLFLLSLVAFVPLGAQAQKVPLRPFAPSAANRLPGARARVAPAQLSKAYGITAGACGVQTKLDFAQRPLNEDWKNHVPIVVGAAPRTTTIETAGTYTAPAGTRLQVGDPTNQLIGQPLSWDTDYPAGTSATTYITWSFSRPVENFTIEIQDIDLGTVGTVGSDFQDAVTFDSYTGDNTLLDLSNPADATVALDANYDSRTNNTIYGIRNNPNLTNNGLVRITFNKPILKFTIKYQNTETQNTDPGIQAIGINYMAWCTQADIAVAMTGPNHAQPGATASYTVTTSNIGDFDGQNVQPRVYLGPGLLNVSSPSGGSYDTGTGYFTLPLIALLPSGAGANSVSTSVVSATMPSTSINAAGSATMTTQDADASNNNGSLANAKVTTAVNQAPNTADRAASFQNTASFTPIAALQATDPEGDAILNYTLDATDLSALAALGKLYVNNAGIRTEITTTTFPGLNLTPTEATQLEFDPTAAANGSVALHYTATDALGGTDASPATYTFSVSGAAPANLPPTAQDVTNAAAISVAAAQTQISALQATDLDGTIASYRISTLPAGGGLYYNNSGTYVLFTAAMLQGGTTPVTLTLAQAATLKFDPSGTVTGPVSFTFTALDNQGALDATPATFSITISNQEPVAENISNAAPIANTLGQTTISPLVAADADGSIATFQIVSLPSDGKLYYNSTGTTFIEITSAMLLGQASQLNLTPAQAKTLKYAPSGAVDNTNLTFTYTATDNNGLRDSSPATYSIRVGDTPPTATDVVNSASTFAKTDGQKTISPLAGTVFGAGNTISSFQIASLPTDGDLYYNSAGTTYTLVTGAMLLGQAGQLNLTVAQAGTLKFDPSGNYAGNLTFTFTVTDNSDPTKLTDPTPATYTITVTNALPTANNVTNTLNTPIPSSAGQTTISPLSASDTDGTIAYYTISTLPTKGKLYYNESGTYIELTSANISTAFLDPTQASSLKYDPLGTTNGTDTFTFTATDNDGGVDATPATYTLTVGNVVPVAVSGNNVNIGNSSGYKPLDVPSLRGTDVDGTIVSFTLTGGFPVAATQGTLRVVGTTAVITSTKTLAADAAGNLATNLEFNPVAGAVGNVVLQFTVTDNSGATSSNTATYTIPIGQSLPVAADVVSAPIPRNSTLAKINTLSAKDADTNTTFLFQITSLSANGTLYYNNNADGISGVSTAITSAMLYGQAGQVDLSPAQAASLKFTPTTGFLGTTTFQYTAKDNTGNYDPTPATFSITTTNILPTATNTTSAPAIARGSVQAALSPLRATDADGTIATFQLTSLPTNGTLYYNSNADGASGIYTAVTSNDLLSGSAQKNLTLAQAGSLKFTPAGANTADVTFTFTATDNDTGVDATPATYTIRISNALPNTDDKAAGPIASSAGNTNLPALTGNDPDGTVVSYSLTGITAAFNGRGMLSIFDGTTRTVISANTTITVAQAAQLQFDPSGTYNGPVTFSMAAIDNDGGTDATPATYTITLSNTAPVATDVTNAPALARTAAQTQLDAMKATDPDGSIASYQLITLPTSGTLFYNTGTSYVAVTAANLYGGTAQLNLAASDLKFTPAATTALSSTFTFRATDNQGLISANTATYTIPFSNTLPVAANVTSSPVIVRGSTQAPISALSATDADGTIAGYQISTLPTSGTLFYNSTGSTYLAVTNVMLYGGSSQLNLTAAQAASLKFTPAAGSTLADVTFTYTATDNNSGVDATPATYTIQLSNVAPQTADVAAPSMPSSNGPTGIPPFSGSDADGTVASFKVTGLPSTATVGTLSLFDGTTRTPLANNAIVPAAQVGQLQFDPSGQSNGTFTFGVAAIDNDGGIDATPATYTLVLGNVAPVATDVTHAPALARTSTAQTPLDPMKATDADGTIASYQLTSLPTSGTLFYTLDGTTYNTVTAADLYGGAAPKNLAANALKFTPAATTALFATFTFRATDNQGLISANTATYTVPFSNTLPTVANTATAMPSSNASTAIPVPTATDADGTIATYTLSNVPAFTLGTLYSGTTPVTAGNFPGLSLTLAQAQNLMFDPAGASNGSFVFNFTATDNNGGVSATTAAYTITVQNVAPQTADVTAPSMPSSNGPTSIPPFSGSDADGTVVSYAITGINATFNGRGTLSYDNAGTRTAISAATTTITAAQATTLQFDPSGTYNGVVTFNVAAIDNDGGIDATPATYTLVLGNVAPVATDVTGAPIASASTGKTTLNVLKATDADGSIASYQLTSLPTSGTLYYTLDGGTTYTTVTAADLYGGAAPKNLANNALKFTPSGTTNVASTFTFRATDNQGLISANTATYTIPLNNAVPQALVVTNSPSIPSTNGQTTILPLKATDSDGTIAYYQLLTLPANGSLYYNNGGTYTLITAANLAGGTAPLSLNPTTQANALKYDPSGAFAGSDNFIFTATDNNGATDANGATYTNPVTQADIEAVYSTPNTYQQKVLSNGSTVATVSDGNGAIVSATLTGGTTLPVFLALNPGTGAITVNGGTVVPGTYTATVFTVDAKGGESTIPVSITVNNALPTTSNVTNSPALLNTAAATSILPLLASDADGSVVSFTLSNLPGAGQGVLSVFDGTTSKDVNTTNFPGLVLTPTQAQQLQFDPAAGSSGSATFNFTATDNNGGVSTPAALYTIPVEAPGTIGGYVFEDVNYGGGPGRAKSVAGAVVLAGAKVELYFANGNPVLAGSTVMATTTDATGRYSFANMASGDYVVRVVNSTVISSRSGSVNTLVGVQTFVNGDGSKVGGTTPTSVDGAANTGAQTLTQVGVAQSLAAVTITNGTVLSSVDFGFNFDVVVNTLDAGQGSLRQFVLNSNALTNAGLDQAGLNTAGVENSIFMIPASSLTTTTGTNKAAIITLNSGLKSIGAKTTINGTTQTTLIGNTNTTGPEVIVNLRNLADVAFSISAADVIIDGLSITGAGATAGNLTAAGNTDGTAVLITGAGDRAIVRNSTLSGNIRAGVLVNGATGVQIVNNVINDNGTATGFTNANGNGIALYGSNSAGISGNVISGNAGFGINMTSSTNATPLMPINNSISGNTVTNNGASALPGATQLAGLALVVNGTGNSILLNTFAGNKGDGILATAGSVNTFSQNSFSANGQQSIDLGTGASGDGVTLNDNQDPDTGANGLLNFPVISQVTISNNHLLVTGFVTSGANVELYLAAPDNAAENFGEGKTYLKMFQEGSTDDTDARKASYSGLVGGIAQGAETNQNLFRFDLDLATLSAAQRALVTSGAKFTATATLAAIGTSEFAGNRAIVTGPLPVELMSFEAKAVKRDAQLTWATASEKNNDHFDVERSFNGTAFERIAQVKGNGTTTARHDYALTDANVGARHTGPVYYRLQQVDVDGETHVSPLRAVTFEATATAEVTIYPNPAIGHATVDMSGLPAGSYHVQVVDMAGRTVLDTTMQGGAAQLLDTQAWAEGAYEVLIHGNQLSVAKKLVKTN